jgi:uncharacterized protein (TIGR02145 family)
VISRFYLLLTAGLVLATASQCSRRESNTVKDIDDNIYSTALIGDYRWMTENLKTVRLNDGSAIPCIKDQSAWLRMDSAAYCYYQNNEAYADTLGFLYNWYAVNSGKLCPAGWRVPSDKEWMQIEGTADTRFGPGDSVWRRPGLRGYDAGQRLRSVSGWRKGIPGTNDLGFSALPGGERLTRFFAGGSSGFWWTSTEASAASAYYRSIIYSFESVSRDTHPKRMGFSVRCIRDK